MVAEKSGVFPNQPLGSRRPFWRKDFRPEVRDIAGIRIGTPCSGPATSQKELRVLVPRVRLGEFSPIHRFGLTAGAEAKPGRERCAGLFQINPQSWMVVVPCCVVWIRDTPPPPPHFEKPTPANNPKAPIVSPVSRFLFQGGHRRRPPAAWRSWPSNRLRLVLRPPLLET